MAFLETELLRAIVEPIDIGGPGPGRNVWK
jgi:hypothetical protein